MTPELFDDFIHNCYTIVNISIDASNNVVPVVYNDGFRFQIYMSLFEASDLG
ncbi:hypothetical protein SAMN05192574_108249 [Mucilaginibacter gossypiicola]|uniref:Uncharacterized protein n=1 Tax=Mucilaginibacter gossypiicola TaxID=551995 RepID=A0A1H8Q377_9SPHI|nr:hypothetical protein SAMN05192574_108249 [Mucilaginibacter gossypiicola]